ncbi:MAG: DMT family transporter [Polyangiaceae bacterium]
MFAPSRVTALLVVLIASLCFSTSGPLARMAAPASPLLIAAARTGIASLLLLGRAPLQSIAEVRRTSWPQRRVMLVAGLLLAGHFGFFLYGLATTSLAAAVTLVSLEPVAVVVAAALAFNERPSTQAKIGIALATLGAVIVAQGGGSGEHTLLGDLFVVIAVVLYGAYVMSARRLAGAISANAYAAVVFGTSAVSLAIVCGFAGVSLDIPARSWWLIVALGVIPTLGGHTLVQWAVRWAPASVVALVSPGETLGSLAIAAVLMSLPPSPVELMGAVVVRAGAVATLLAPASITPPGTPGASSESGESDT